MDQKPSPTPPQTPTIISTDKIIEVNPSKDIWLQQPGEPDKWYANFTEFLNAGSGRSLREVATKVLNRPQKSLNGNWRDASVKYSWIARAGAYDKSRATQKIEANQSYRQQAETNTEAAIARITQILKECVEEEDEEKYQKYAKKLNLLILGTGRAAEVLFKAHRCLFGERQHIESTHSFKTVVMEFE